MRHAGKPCRAHPPISTPALLRGAPCVMTPSPVPGSAPGVGAFEDNRPEDASAGRGALRSMQLWRDSSRRRFSGAAERAARARRDAPAPGRERPDCTSCPPMPTGCSRPRAGLSRGARGRCGGSRRGGPRNRSAAMRRPRRERKGQPARNSAPAGRKRRGREKSAFLPTAVFAAISTATIRDNIGCIRCDGHAQLLLSRCGPSRRTGRLRPRPCAARATC